MNTIKRFRYFLVFLVPGFFAACGVSSLGISNYAQLYSNDLHLHPEYRVYHVSEDSTVLYFRVSTNNLLYNRSEKNADFQARIKFEVKVFASLDEKLPLISDSIVFVDYDNTQRNKELIGSLKMAIPKGRNFICKTILTDLNRNSENIRFLRVFKEEGLIERQGFLGYDDQKIPIIGRIIKSQANLFVKYDLYEVKAIRFITFRTLVRPALPPFSDDTVSGESLTIKSKYLINDSAGFFKVPVTESGSILFFQADSSISEGTTLLKFGDYYPSVSSGDDMVGPLRYLTTDDEFQQLLSAENKKIAAENFWIRCCGSKERAKEVMKKFYRRVEEANEYFTSYKEGWKTDRGMIYVIFGQPNGLYMKETGENWVYGQDANMSQINCLFGKVDNPFAENDLILQRSQSYRPIWYAAIESWRTGRVFSL